jgi:hypothetical protein
MSQPQSRVACDRTLPMENRGDAIGRHLQLTRQRSRAHPQGVELFGQVFSGVDGDSCHGGPPKLVIVQNFDADRTR